MSPTQSTVLRLDLSLPVDHTFPTQTPSSLPRSLTPLGSSHSTLQLSLAMNMPKPYLKFPSPMPNSLGMRTAHEWHCKQLLQACLRMEQHNALRRKKGQIPMTLTTSLICDHAHEDADLGITATDTPLHHDPDNPQCPYPFHPGHYPYTSPRELQSNQVGQLPRSLPTWQLFASHVKMPSHWSINCHRPSSKTTKLLTPYHQPMLPKGWRYEVDEAGVKSEALDEQAMVLFDRPAITLHAKGSARSSKCLKILRSTRGSERYPSPSLTSSVDPCRLDTSRST